MSDEYPRVEVSDRAEWRAWLAENHKVARGVWLVRGRKGTTQPYMPYDDIVEESLCFGWVDSQPRKLDADRSLLLVTPRKAGSRWSRANKERIARLQGAGLMAEAGNAAVARAKADGTWTALDSVEDLVEDDDLRAALDSAPGARANWDAFPPSVRRGILEWILSAKRPETRANRIRETAEQAAKNIRANQWRKPGGHSPKSR